MHLVKPAPCRHIDLTAENRLDAPLNCRLVKLNDPVHIAVIGDCHGSLPKFFGTVQQFGYGSGAVKQAVCRVGV